MCADTKKDNTESHTDYIYNCKFSANIINTLFGIFCTQTSHAENEHISQQIHIIQNEDQISGQDLGELGPHQYIIQEKSNNIAIPSQHIILKQENVVGSDPPNQIIVQGQLPEYVQIVSGDDIQQGHLQIVEQVTTT